MSPNAVPTRITIDFRDAMHPSRSWILGLDTEPGGRVELLAFERPAVAVSLPRPGGDAQAGGEVVGACSCPDFCERDHANE